MSPTWNGAPPPAPVPLCAGGVLRIALRGLLLGLVTYGGLVLLLVLRLAEAPLFAPRRPLTPWITQAVCQAALVILGLRLRTFGRPMAGTGALVVNHTSWLDIFVLNAVSRGYFVAKAEVAGWPGIGWLARATGCFFIRRDRAEAAAQAARFAQRLRAGHRLLFFPEGTSTDGLRVLAFKPTLFAAFFAPGLDGGLQVQPVSITYHAPAGQDARFYGWWGAMDFAPHLIKVLAAPRQGRVEVVFHPPVAVAETAGRKQLAARCEAAVRAGMRLPAGPGERAGDGEAPAPSR